MKFGYFFDEQGSCQVRCDEAAVVRFVFEHYVNEHKSMDVLSYQLPLEVSPGILGGSEWRRRHVFTILPTETMPEFKRHRQDLFRGDTPQSFQSNYSLQFK